MRTCSSCGNTIQPHAKKWCPKCDTPLQAAASYGLLEVDIAHSGQTWDTARKQLLKAVQMALFSGHSGLKVIHGRNGVIKDMAHAYLNSLAQEYAGKLATDKGNPGATILWLSSPQ